MDSKHRNSLIVASSILVTLVAGWQIANESLFLAGLIASGLLLCFGTMICGVRPDALVAGIVLAGYLIGNRGFAQLSIPTVPLLPGELTLGLGLSVAVWKVARTQMLPVRRDFLNIVLLTWLAFGAVRIVIDARVHGLVAVRDFAILYYALFFFLAQGWWTDPDSRRWLRRCLSVGFAVGAPVFMAFVKWPDFFINNFNISGVPLIFVKGDVQAGLLVAGTFWFLHRFVVTRRTGWLVLTVGNLLGVVLANSRAGLVALAAACVWILLCRDWRMLRPIAAIIATGIFVLISAPIVTQTPWKRGLAYRFVETATSITDISGTGTYSVDLNDKPDNNLFRLTWWRSVVDETWAEGRWLGLGFGFNLSEQFVRIYYTEGSEEFSTRSPHNYLLTVFGRTGIVGLGLLLVCLAIVAMRTWQSGRTAARTGVPTERFALLVGSWGIFVSACFGVVLEGSMGAAIYWSLLGMANAPEPAAEAPTRAGAVAPSLHLREPASPPQVAYIT